MVKDAGRQRRLLLKVTATVVVLLGLYALLGFVVAPKVVRSQLIKYVNHDGYRLDIEKVAFNPFVLSMEITGLRLDDPDGKLLGRFARFYVNLQVSSLWHWAPTFADIELHDSKFNLVRDRQGHFNWKALVDTLTPPSPRPPPQKQEQEEATGRLIVSKFEVRDLRATFTDQSRTPQFSTDLGPLTLTVRDFSTYREGSSPYRLHVVTPRGGKITWSGTVAVEPLRSSGSLDVQGVPLTVLANYFRQLAPALAITDGTLAIRGSYHYDSNLTLDGGHIAVSDLTVVNRERDQPLLKVPKLAVDAIRADLDQRRVTVGSVSGNGIDLNEARLADGSTLWQSSLAGIGGGSGSGSATTGGSPGEPAVQEQAGGAAKAGAAATDKKWHLSLSHLEFSGMRAGLADQTLTPAFSIAFDPIHVDLRRVEWPAATIGSFTVDSKVSTGGSVGISGSGKVDPLDLDVAVKVQELALAAAQPYVNGFAAVNVDSGTASADASVTLKVQPDAPLAIRVTGGAGLADISISGKDKSGKLLALQSMNAKGIDLDIGAQSWKVGSIALAKPFARLVVHKDGTTSISDALQPGGSGKETSGDKPAAAASPASAGSDAKGKAAGERPLVQVGKVSVSDGELDFADQSLIRPFHVVVNELQGAVSNISSLNDHPALIELKGQVNKTAPVSIDGHVSSFGKPSGKVDLSFGNLSLTELNPFATTYAGYAIDRGKLDARFSYEVEGDRLKGDNHFVVRQLELGRKVESPRAIDIPLALGIALLKDSDGTIDLNLPVEGDITSPSFSLGSIIGKAFTQVITKAATAPFKLLAGLVGGSADELDKVTFEPGSAELQSKQLSQVQQLADALNRRPQLTLGVRGTAAPDADARALAGRQLDDRLDAMEDKPVGSERDRWKRAYGLYKKETGKSVDDLAASLGSSGKPSDEAVHEAVWQALLERQHVGGDALRSLANARAQAIVGALSNAGIASKRIYLQDPDVQVSSEQGSVASRLSVST